MLVVYLGELLDLCWDVDSNTISSKLLGVMELYRYDCRLSDWL